jgi:hypothetical protein
MHGVAAGQLDLVSGDAPGTTSKYIEDTFDDKIVALWSSGAAGDQNPLYYQQTYDLREIRIKEYASRGVDISNSMPPGAGLNKKDPQVIKLMNQQKQMILSMGQFLGEEVMHVMRGMERMETDLQIDGRQKTVQCPGRERTDTGRAGYPGTYKDAGPVDIRLGSAPAWRYRHRCRECGGLQPHRSATKERIALRANHDGDAHQWIRQFRIHSERYRVRDVHVRGASSRLQPGCAETAIVNGILDLMQESKK